MISLLRRPPATSPHSPIYGGGGLLVTLPFAAFPAATSFLDFADELPLYLIFSSRANLPALNSQ